MNNDAVSVNPHFSSVSGNPSVLSNNISLSCIGPCTWFICDFSIAFICAVIAFLLTPYSDDIQLELVRGEHVGRLAFCVAYGFLVALIAHVFGLHEHRQQRSLSKLVWRCGIVSCSAALVLSIELLLVHYLLVGRLILVSTVTGCSLGLFVCRALIVALLSRKSFIVGFVGSNNFVALVPDLLDANSSQGLEILSLNIEDSAGDKLIDWVRANGVNQVVVDPNDRLKPSQNDLLKLMNRNVVVSNYSSFIEKLYQRIPSEHISARWVLECQTKHAILYKAGLKRVLDVVIATLALAVLLPFGILAAVFVKLDSPGPVIFRQVRVGQYGRPITIYKIRTMIENAESAGAQWASVADTRVTAVGRFLRRSRLDEMPQLFNVLSGEMSLVGPRPERPEFTADLEPRIPFFVHRLLVKPGITGWAQVNAGYSSTEAEAVTKLSFDLYYIKNLSLGLDLRVLLRTISTFASGSR